MVHLVHLAMRDRNLLQLLSTRFGERLQQFVGDVLLLLLLMHDFEWLVTFSKRNCSSTCNSSFTIESFELGNSEFRVDSMKIMMPVCMIIHQRERERDQNQTKLNQNFDKSASNFIQKWYKQIEITAYRHTISAVNAPYWIMSNNAGSVLYLVKRLSAINS